MDFSNVGQQLAYWLGNIGQAFKGGYDGSGENGIDVGMPVGTPVYAVESGDVVGHGYYGGGGVVSVHSAPQRVWYYQHFDLVAPGIEDGSVTHVEKGQLVGWSGGQSGYGHHPVSSLAYSNDGHGHGWPHIEVGVNAPWGGIWGPMSLKGANTDPVPLLRQLQGGATGAPTGTTLADTGNGGGGGGSGSSDPCGPMPNFLQILIDPGTLGGWIACKQTGGSTGGEQKGLGGLQGLINWIRDPLRLVKVIGGALLLVAGFVLFALPSAGTAAEVAGVATGQPEVAAVGRAAQARGAKGKAMGGASAYRARSQRKEREAKRQEREAKRQEREAYTVARHHQREAKRERREMEAS